MAELTFTRTFSPSSEVATTRQTDGAAHKLKPRSFHKSAHLRVHSADFHPGVNHAWQHHNNCGYLEDRKCWDLWETMYSLGYYWALPYKMVVWVKEVMLYFVSIFCYSSDSTQNWCIICCRWIVATFHLKSVLFILFLFLVLLFSSVKYDSHFKQKSIDIEDV